MPIPAEINGYRLSQLVVDRFRLDGGAMFGSVPKNLWSRRIVADSENRIQLCCRMLILEGHGRKIAIEVGSGTKWDEKQRAIYCFEPQLSLPLQETLFGVTDIIITHLHFDHAGGLTYRDAEGNLHLTFPDATVHIQKKNWERAHEPGPRERATYFPANFAPLEQGKLKLCSPGEEIFPGVAVFEANGHTDGLQWVKISGPEGVVAFPSDLIPTAHHVPIAYLMGYDLCASTTMREKELFLTEAAREGWWVVFGHDAETCGGQISYDKKGSFELVSPNDLPIYSA